MKTATPAAPRRQFLASFTAPWAEAEAFADALESAYDPAALAVSLWEEDETTGLWLVEVYYDREPAPETLSAVLKPAADRLGVPTPLPEVGEIVARDWIAASLAELHPVEAGRFFVHGSHDRQRRRGGAVALEIDAGQAFGTGHHGTTGGCLLALSDLIKRAVPRRIIDIGCGTGVLAVAAARALRSPVLAVDIDPVATAVARDNVRRNAVAGLVTVVTASGLAHPRVRSRAPFDLVMANILAGPLVRLAPDVAGATKSGGHVILSGLFVSQERRVTAAYVGRGFRLCRRIRRGSWSTLVLARRP